MVCLYSVFASGCVYKSHNFFGIQSRKVITFSESIPKKSYICNVKICYYDTKKYI